MTSLGAHIYEPHFKTLRLTKTPTDSNRLGWFQGLASTYDIDRDGERFAFGAWTESIFQWQKAGTYPPLFFNHRTADPEDIVGRVLSMKETVDGLLIEGMLDLTNPRAESAYERMLAGTLDSMSVGFLYERTHTDEDGVTVIDEAELLEISLTPIPSNQYARVSRVKSTAFPGDPLYYDRLLDDLMVKTRPAVDPDVVDAFIQETKELMVQEAFDRADQTAWEERTQSNLVLDPVPVRVDARMRPVTR
jgi:HK97 family phage prohead protease